ncbi:hypothetical protein [Companilactobacillus sp.]|uniref:flavodoxin n=1 Tax=Companilactobacillus sp. TaxID=2767905 RepID=UPI0026269E59|nr:hypothetical protein [Companilactobacillus sp.]
MKGYVVYFSQSGNNKRLADSIAEEYNLPVSEITPKEEYPSDYSELESRAKIERFKKLDVEINDITIPLDTDTLIVASPIWYADLPRPVVSFSKQQKSEFKRVILVSDKFMVGFGFCGLTMKRHTKGHPNIEKISTSYQKVKGIL